MLAVHEGSKCTASWVFLVVTPDCWDVIMILHHVSVIYTRWSWHGWLCRCVMSKSSRCHHISANMPQRELPVLNRTRTRPGAICDVYFGPRRSIIAVTKWLLRPAGCKLFICLCHAWLIPDSAPSHALNVCGHVWPQCGHVPLALIN